MAFLFVFLMSMLGFGIAFHSLFPDRPEFAGPGATFLTLFNAALGDHNFASVGDHTYQHVGVTTMAVYAMLVTIILFNLIVARMSSTFEKIHDNAHEQWSMVMAKNVQDCLLICEKVPSYEPPHVALSIML